MSRFVFMLIAVCLVSALMASASFADGRLMASRLLCEYAPSPSNVDLPHPRLSWTLSSPSRGDAETAYQILVSSTSANLKQDRGDLWDSGKVSSDQCNQIICAAPGLVSAQRCFWKVRVWDKNDQPSDWSEPAGWSMGLLSPEDWSAKWITSAKSVVEAAGEASALGYHAAVSDRADDAKWVQVDLGKSYPIESVKLHSLDHEVAGFGFPIRFTVTASDDPDFKDAATIADQSKKNYANPGAAAVVFKADGVKGRYVRVNASRLFHRVAGGQTYCFALAELEVFSGGKNVALNAPVTALDSTEGYGWGKAELTDGVNLAPDLGSSSAKALKGMPIFRRSFAVTKPLSRATMFICGLGQYELDLNGAKVGNSALDPGWTDYRKTCLYQSYDLTEKLKNGNNVFDVMLGNGMYNVVATSGRYSKFTGSMGPPKLIGQLQLTYTDGTTQTIATDDSWQVTGGPITFSSTYGGEDFDARLENSTGWEPASETNGPGGKLVGLSQSAPPITVAAVMKVQKITNPKPGVWVYDLGQNCAQVPAITVSGAAGASVRMTPGEVLNSDGTVSQQPSGGPTYYTYTLSGRGSESWSPRFTYYGCRYFEVSGAVPAGSPNPSSLPVITELHGNFITSTSPIVGEFRCSNPMFNRTAEIIRWAMRNNLMSVLTDCPHREKLGWLEENHLVGPSLMYNLQIPSLFTKVCGDMADAQTAEGLVPDIAPEYAVFSGGFRDSPEWGSSSVLIPWQLYQWYGDTTILTNRYSTMKRYVDYLSSQAKNHMLSNGLGDWYDIGPKEPGYAQLTPPTLTATAFYYRDLTILAQAAKLLGNDADSDSYTELAKQVREAFNSTLYHPNTHSYSTGSQTANAIPLVFGMPPEADRQAIIDNIVADVRKRNNGLTAGDVGYRYLLRALADGGRSDVIFDMNSRSDRPGYGMIIAKGATALTEAWDGRLSSSQDHFMLGHIMEWFYGDLAGIQPDPTGVGYRKITIKPTPVGDVTWAKATYRSINGTIQTSWSIKGHTFSLDVLIPPGSTATVMMPKAYHAAITEGGKPVGDVKDLSIDLKNPSSPRITISSGSYHFESHSN